MRSEDLKACHTTLPSFDLLAGRCGAFYQLYQTQQHDEIGTQSRNGHRPCLLASEESQNPMENPNLLSSQTNTCNQLSLNPPLTGFELLNALNLLPVPLIFRIGRSKPSIQNLFSYSLRRRP